MKTKNIWQMCCQLRDLLLWSSFTPEEIQQFATVEGYTLELCPCLEYRLSVMSAAHRACATDNVLSRRIQSDLDDRCNATHEWVARTPEMVQFQVSRSPVEDMPAALPELLWAVARDGRSQLSHAEVVLSWRLMVEGARQYTFGQVELIEV